MTINYGYSDVAKLSWKQYNNIYIFLRKQYAWFSKKSFFFQKSYLFKINICIPFQQI